MWSCLFGLKDKDTKDALRSERLASRRNPQGKILEDRQSVAGFAVSYLAQTEDMYAALFRAVVQSSPKVSALVI